MTYFTCAGCGVWEDNYNGSFSLRGKTFCSNCYNKLLDKFPELEDMDWNDSGSTWQVSEEEWAKAKGLPIPKKKRISWKTIIPATFKEQM